MLTQYSPFGPPSECMYRHGKSADRAGFIDQVNAELRAQDYLRANCYKRPSIEIGPKVSKSNHFLRHLGNNIPFQRDLRLFSAEV